MEEQEIREKWLAYELYLFIMPYLLIYGEEYINDPQHSVWLRWQFEREWKRKSEEEKEARLLEFIKLLKGEEEK